MPLSLKRFVPRITIERLRTLVLIGAGALVLAIASFLGFGQWKLHRFLKDVPKRLGIDISQEANGVNYTQSRKGKTLFKIHAARAVQMKSSGKTLLHDVRIDLYGDDGQRTDTISGSEFEYDPGAGLAQAAGAVDITVMRPGVKPAIAQLKPSPAPQSSGAPNAVPNSILDNEIHVKTSGLLFNQKTGVATTTQRVDFALLQGTGSSTGATYDSAHGQLILDRSVELHVQRDATQSARGPVTIHASHADFERTRQLCTLLSAVADYNGGSATTGSALIHFREDGSVLRLDGSNGVDLKTLTGGHVTAPRGTMDFDEQNHPRHGLLEGGAHLDMTQPNRTIQGTAPIARLAFDSAGQLSQAHLEQGVAFTTQQSISTAKGATGQVHRNWHSQTADIAFATVPAGSGKAPGSTGPGNTGKVEPRTIHGYGGVVIHSETTLNGVLTPSKLAADTVVAELAPGGTLSSLVGNGHASFDQQTAKGVHQASSSDQLEVKFLPPSPTAKSKTDSEIASIVQVGHVVLTQDAAKPGASPVKATANRADYDGPTELLHLSGAPRLQNGPLDMTANRIDFARTTGDAFAHGDVKASWSAAANAPNSGKPANPPSVLPGASLLSGGTSGEPVHAIAAEAELHQDSEEVLFRSAPSAGKSPSGNLPRLWQGSNSVAAPLITLNRQKQTLIAQTNSASSPVQTVLLSNTRPKSSSSIAKPNQPSVIRLRSGELHYSEGERLAIFSSGVLGHVTAETSGANGPATVVSQQAEIQLLPAGIHPAPRTTPSGSTAQNSSIDQMTATGHVTVDWPDRKGTGEKLVYRSEDGTFTLTGTAAAPPRITDQTRGTATGSALIFHSRDDSVTVEGDGGETVTETQAPKKQPK